MDIHFAARAPAYDRLLPAAMETLDVVAGDLDPNALLLLDDAIRRRTSLVNAQYRPAAAATA